MGVLEEGRGAVDIVAGEGNAGGLKEAAGGSEERGFTTAGGAEEKGPWGGEF